MTIPLLPHPKRGGCRAMTVDLRAPAPLEVDIRQKTMRVDLAKPAAMEVELCWPKVHFDYVVHNGVPITHDGEYVLVLIED